MGSCAYTVNYWWLWFSIQTSNVSSGADEIGWNISGISWLYKKLTQQWLSQFPSPKNRRLLTDFSFQSDGDVLLTDYNLADLNGGAFSNELILFSKLMISCMFVNCWYKHVTIFLFLMLKCLVFARKLLHYNLISDTLNTNCTGNFPFYLNNILTWYVYFYSSRIFRNLLQYWSQLLLHFTLNNCQEMFELIKSATFIKIYSEIYLSCFYTFMFDANNHLERFPTKPHGKVNCWHLMILPNETEPGFF